MKNFALVMGLLSGSAGARTYRKSGQVAYPSHLVRYLNAGINFIHNHPPAHPRGFAPKISPTLGLLCPRFCPGGGHLLGQIPRGGHLSMSDVCHY